MHHSRRLVYTDGICRILTLKGVLAEGLQQKRQKRGGQGFLNNFDGKIKRVHGR